MTRLGAVAVFALSGIVAAFATIPPQPDADLPLARAALIEPLAIDPAEHVIATPERFVREERFQAGETVTGLLARLGVAEADAQQLVRLKELRRLRAGTTVTAEVGPAGELLSMGFLGVRDSMTVIGRDAAGFRAGEERASLETQIAMKSGVIRSSLFAAADASGIPDAVAMQLADVFGGDIDFYRDLRRGDRFSVVYELQALNGRPVRSGRVLAAEFRNQGRNHRAVWYSRSDADGKKSGGYYSADGKNLRKAFLRTPLEFSRVSSGFGMRQHPFLHAWRAHRGVDYAAPAGTRVRSVGDGVVEFAGRQGGYGNVVILRHAGNATTLYAHLNAFVRGLHKGTRLAQGDTVGYVGQTGWATGPHLHYEFRIAGLARNPLAVALPAAQPVAAYEMSAFRGQAEPLIARLDLLGLGGLALLE